MESHMTINRIPLTQGQAMTIRVALESLAMDISKSPDDYGEIGTGYMKRIEELRRYMGVTNADSDN